MKNALNHLSLLLIFILYLSSQGVPAQSGALKNVDYCALFDSSKFAGQTVKTSAIMFVPKINGNVVDGPSPFFYSPGCNNRDHFAVANFSLNEDASWTKKVQKDIVPNGPELFYSVTLEGKFLIADQPMFGDLNYARAELKVITVVSIERIRDQVAHPDWDAESPIYDTGSSLHDISTRLVLGLIRSKFGDADNVDTEGAKITLEQGTARVEDLFKFIRNKGRKGFSETAGADAEVLKEGNKWRVKGTLTLSATDRSRVAFRYESEYLRVENRSWKLLSINISLQK